MEIILKLECSFLKAKPKRSHGGKEVSAPGPQWPTQKSLSLFLETCVFSQVMGPNPALIFSLRQSYPATTLIKGGLFPVARALPKLAGSPSLFLV